MHIKNLWIRPAYLEWILQGLKTVEVRAAYPNISRLEPGDRLMLNKIHPYEIVRIDHYPDFQALLAAEDPAVIAPGMEPEEILELLGKLYPPEKEALGAVALEIAPDTREEPDGSQAELDAPS